MTWALVTVVMMSSLTLGIFQGKPDRYFKRDRDLRALIPWVSHQFGYDLFFDFREQRVSRLPANYGAMWSMPELHRAIRGAHLKKADLRYADMFQAFLAKANLRNSDLRGSRLRDADFQKADLRGANMVGADLRQANFRSADFREANLVRANFGRTDLRQAQLGNTDMREADFRDTKLTEADLRCADLRGAVNLAPADLRQVKTLYRAQLDEALHAMLTSADARLFAPPADTWHHLATAFNVHKKNICE